MIFLPISISKVTNLSFLPLRSINLSILEAQNNLTRVILVPTHLTPTFTQRLSITPLLAAQIPDCKGIIISVRLRITFLVILNKSKFKKPNKLLEVQIKIIKAIRIVFSLVNPKKIILMSNLKMITNLIRNHTPILNLSELSCSRKQILT